VYHLTFIEQLFRYVRARCIYCSRFRLARVEINKYVGKLKLIKYGLLAEAEELDDVGLRKELDDDNNDAEDIIDKRNRFVNKCIKKAGGHRKDFDLRAVRSEAAMETRRAILTEFQADIVKSRACKTCKGISPTYRKVGAQTFFEKPLNAKESAANAQNNKRAPLSALAANQQAEKERRRVLEKKRKNDAMDIDEGVADMDSTPEEEIVDPMILDDEIAGIDLDGSAGTGGNSLVQTEAVMTDFNFKVKDKGQKYLSPEEIHAGMIQLFEKEREILDLIYPGSGRREEKRESPVNMFFIRALIVPPNKYRKEQMAGGGQMTESADNAPYKEILKQTEIFNSMYKEIQGLKDAPNTVTRAKTIDDLSRRWEVVQTAVNTLIDSDKSGLKGPAALRVTAGIKQKLEKKEGMFRMNIMGKRVNFAARSVISPDPNIETNEIGVPPVFAKKLTYPEPVTTHNFDELKEAVKNGPRKWPGAVAIEFENGQVVLLKDKTDEERQAMANLLLATSSTTMTGVRNKKVHRHLNNGDIVIMNRQPTLHKPSMMCHRAKVLPGEKTIRMHYANCNTYNADFDGDEMNMHFPQNEIARAEALQIADTDHQYLSATAGNPLRGLIQDHLSMGVWLTSKDTFFTREEYQELIYSGLRPEHNHTQNERVLTLDPDIIKPYPMWTGKQVISTVLLNIKPSSYAPIFLHSKSQTPSDRWGEGSDEGVVRVEDGKLITGILDKKQIGPASGGLVHTVYEAYGHTIAGKFLSILGRLLTKLLHMRAFSCGVEDLVMTDKGEADRRRELEAARTVGLGVAADYVTLGDKKPKANDPELLLRLESVLRDDSKQAGLDTMMNGKTAGLSSAITKACLPNGLVKSFPKNNMQAMTTSGAKGSMVNANLISCNLGQQVLEGRRVPVMVSGKTLPSFRPYESDVRAGGYIVDRFLTGVRPQEYYFHAMAGREGLIDTAVKTSRSGYLQRVLIKGLEGLRADYDSSVRDSDGTIIQTLYGEDGLDITRSQSVYDFKFISKNFMSLYASLGVRSELKYTLNQAAIEHNKQATKKFQKSNKLDCADTALSKYFPLSNTGSTSEKFYMSAKKYADENPDKSIRDKGDKNPEIVPKRVFNEILNVNYMKAIVQPGEAIGVVAGQSIGEPSTQMTLNTFHLAGHSAKNVTLGIPRLREILMTASKNLNTPTMTLYPHEDLPAGHAEEFAKGISKLSLAEVIDDISVEERISTGIHGDTRIYEVHLQLFPGEEYTKEYAITIKDVARKIEASFLPLLARYVRIELKKRGEEKSLAKATDARPDIAKGRAPNASEAATRTTEMTEREEQEAVRRAGGDSDAEDDGDDDATDAKNRANLDEGMTYEDADEDDERSLLKAGIAIDPEDEGDVDVVDDEDAEDKKASADDSDNEDAINARAEKPKTSKLSEAARDRSDRLVSAHAELTSFSFDDATGSSCDLIFHYPATNAKLLFLPLILTAAHKCLIHSVPAVSRALITTDDNSTPIIFTEGCNLRAAWDWQDVIAPHRIFTNDIHATLQVYGVEAARSTIIRELRAVFESHSIKVDMRHLTLVADYMTRGGGFAAFSRIGMRDRRSAFAKMSFETTTKMLSEAVMDGEVEELEGPSARITVGGVGRMGTGMAEVMMRVDEVREEEEEEGDAEENAEEEKEEATEMQTEM